MPGLVRPGPLRRAAPSAAPVPRRTGLTAAGLIALLPLLAGCNIDKSQWRDYPSMETSTTSARSGGTAAQQPQPVESGLGVIGGSDPGTHRADEARVVVTTDAVTCWILVVDGNGTNGCGPATITDSHGIRAGRVTKLGGTVPIQLQLLSEAGETISSGEVVSTDHYVTVRG